MNQAQALGSQLCASAGPDMIPVAVVFFNPGKKTFSVTYHTIAKELLRGQGSVIGQAIAEAVGPAAIPPRIKKRKPAPTGGENE